MTAAPLTVRALARSYRTGFLGLGRRSVLGGLELELRAGERVLIAGPNGSGKSSLLRILAGIESADSGEVLVFGQPITALAARRRIGYAADTCPYPDELRGGEALALAGRLAGLPTSEAKRAAAEGLARVGLAADAGRRLGVYSKGMRRRFHLAQAFLGQPDLLLLDEPADGLDAEGCVVLDELSREAHERGATMLFASHVTDLACERALVLFGGRVAWEGSEAELRSLAGGMLGLYRELATCSATA
ncbi:MAG: ABC transporter ATP-binding protein [Planctomycetota bacterium]|nr:ABC transporter ATP-binding protein [Planctomycetota bacterium]